MNDLSLWCAVYDGPIYWNGRDAFEQIKYLELALERIALELETQPEKCADIAKFAQEVGQGKRHGFEQFVQDRMERFNLSRPTHLK